MSRGLTFRMLAGLVLGVGLGAAARAGLAPGTLEAIVQHGTEPIGAIFLRLLFMLVIPLVISALPLGVAGLGDLRALGRMGLHTLLYTVAVSATAVVIGVALVNFFEPGVGLAPEVKEGLRAGKAAAPPPPVASGTELLVKLVPSNVIKAMAENDLLAVMVFSLFLGVGLAAVRTEPARRLEEGL